MSTDLLKTMLWQLCDLQDSITHVNESGKQLEWLRVLQSDRAALIDRIITLFDPPEAP